MHLKTECRGARSVLLFGILLVTMVVPFQGSAQAPTAGAQPNANQRMSPREILFENERVVVDRRVYEPGLRTDPPGKSHPENPPRDVIRILLTAGDLEINSDGTKVETGRFEVGHVWWWPKPPATHSLANIGKEPVTMIGIRLK